MGSFEAAGWTGSSPIQSITPREQISISFTVFDFGFNSMRQTLHETAGLVVYRLTGRSSELPPGATQEALLASTGEGIGKITRRKCLQIIRTLTNANGVDGDPKFLGKRNHNATFS